MKLSIKDKLKIYRKALKFIKSDKEEFMCPAVESSFLGIELTRDEQTKLIKPLWTIAQHEPGCLNTLFNISAPWFHADDNGQKARINVLNKRIKNLKARL